MFKLTTELINISHFNVVETDHFTVQLKEGFIQKSTESCRYFKCIPYAFCDIVQV